MRPLRASGRGDLDSTTCSAGPVSIPSPSRAAADVVDHHLRPATGKQVRVSAIPAPGRLRSPRQRGRRIAVAANGFRSSAESTRPFQVSPCRATPANKSLEGVEARTSKKSPRCAPDSLSPATLTFVVVVARRALGISKAELSIASFGESFAHPAAPAPSWLGSSGGRAPLQRLGDDVGDVLALQLVTWRRCWRRCRPG